MTLKSDNNPKCTHCILSEAVEAYRNGTGASGLVADQRRDQAEDAYAYSDDQLVRHALIKGLGVVVTELVLEETDPRVQRELLASFESACIDTQVIAAIQRNAKGAEDLA